MSPGSQRSLLLHVKFQLWAEKKYLFSFPHPLHSKNVNPLNPNVSYLGSGNLCSRIHTCVDPQAAPVTFVCFPKIPVVSFADLSAFGKEVREKRDLLDVLFSRTAPSSAFLQLPSPATSIRLRVQVLTQLSSTSTRLMRPTKSKSWRTRVSLCSIKAWEFRKQRNLVILGELPK